jgi:hypothetical protein
MSDIPKSTIDWRASGPAIAVLALVSPPAASAATVVLGLHMAYDWFMCREKDGKGPAEA